MAGCGPAKYLTGHLRSFAPADQLQNQDDQGNDEQNVDQTARHVEAKAKRPEDKKKNKDGPKHKYELFETSLPTNRLWPVPRMSLSREILLHGWTW